MAVELDFTPDPSTFLEAAGDYLSHDPVLNTVVASVAQQTSTGQEEPRDDDWWLVAREDGAVVGAGMRTARFEPRPAYLLPMPNEAAALLASELHERGEALGGVNGALPAAQVCAAQTAALRQETVTVAQHMRLFELTELVEPTPVRGFLRPAEAADVGVALAWFPAFWADADEQAGRPVGPRVAVTLDEEGMLRRIDAGQIWLWVDDRERPVHLTAVNPPSFGCVRIGPVYTPREQRGCGYASAAVAAVSRQALASGARVCLFTDQANPTSNRIYQRLGYRPVVDMANLLVGPLEDTGMPGA